jgi:hypothetical protein
VACSAADANGRFLSGTIGVPVITPLLSFHFNPDYSPIAWNQADVAPFFLGLRQW